MPQCMIKYILVLTLASAISLSGFARGRNQLGIYLGTSFYQGDLNESGIFKGVHPALGGSFRANISKRYALKMNLLYFGLSGSDNPVIELDTRSFSKKFIGFNGQFEISMLPYLPHSDKHRTAPYVFAGLGYTASLGGGSSFANIPFGVGLKHNLTKRLSVDIEWAFHKTFNDKIDNFENFNAQTRHSLTFNNDWYYTAGVIFTYKFFNIAEDCPVYKND